MSNRSQQGFAMIIMLLGFTVLLGIIYLVISKTGVPRSVTSNLYDTSYLPESQNSDMSYQQVEEPSNPFQEVAPSTGPAIGQGVPGVTVKPSAPSISPFVLEPLSITFTDTQFTKFVNDYKPDDLPVSDITFTFSDNLITATTVATSQVVQGPIKVVAVVENKWFRITRVYLGTFELPTATVAQIDSYVQESFNQILASMYLDGLRIESVKGNTMKLSLNAPKGSVKQQGSSVILNQGILGN